MRHQKKGHQIGRGASHRKATLAALSKSLIEHKKITTTYPKAKALRVFVEPLLSRTKEDNSHNRRQVFRHLQDNSAVSELFGEIGPKIGDRPGGYTRIVKLGRRKGDGAEIALIELVDYNDIKPDGSSTTKKKTTRRSRRKKSTAAPAAAAAAATAVEEVADVTEEVADVAEVVEEVAAAPEAVVEEAPTEVVEEVVEEVKAEATEAVEETKEEVEEPVEAKEVVEEAAPEVETPAEEPAKEEAAPKVEAEAEEPATEEVAEAEETVEAASVPEERYPIEALEGVGPAYGQQFRGMDIDYVDQLLEKGATADGRAEIGGGTSFSPEQIQTWVSCADLFRLDGVEGDFAELMQAAGVASVQDLAGRDAAELVAKMEEANNAGEKKLVVDGPPSSDELGKWIDQAKSLAEKLSL